jgi:ABC-type Fe3+-hydroxamate transport system substrate-binding protein
MQVSFKHRPSRRRVHPAPTTRRVISIGASSALTALLLAGCGGGGASTSSGAVSGAAAARDSAQLNAAPGVKSAPGASTRQVEISKPGTQVVGVGPKLTRSASLDLRVKDIGTAAARVRTIAAGLQAIVLTEQIGKGGPGDPLPLASSGRPSSSATGFGALTLSVPSDRLDSALDQISKIDGTVLQRTTSSQDVTSQYVDTQSRLKTMSASVERVRALMAQAKDLGQVVALESEVSRREADLEAMQSQLDALRTSVERSTLAVSLSTPGNEPVTVNGFMAGLRSGWDAFTTSASALLRGVGALLPFAVFFALLGAPLWSWWRRRRTQQLSVLPTPAVPST